MSRFCSASVHLVLVAQAIFANPAGEGDANAQAASEQTGTGQASNRTLQLRVLNSKTGRPEPKVSIGLLIGDRFPGITDEAGEFTISYPGGQSSRLVFDLLKSGFVPVQVSWDHMSPSGPTVIPREYTIKLEPGSSVGGIVKDE